MIEISANRLTYLTVFVLAFVIGTFVYKYHRALYVLICLMALGIIAELLVEINKHTKIVTEELVYNVYIPLEYFLYALFFYLINENKYLRRTIIWSIPFFLIAIVLLTDFRDVFRERLSNQVYTLSGLLTVIWSLWTLFVVKPIKEVKFIRHPLFWICTGLILFYSVSIPFNMMYNSLKENYVELFELLSIIIQKGFNIMFYLSLIIGFLCSHQMKKL